MTRQGFIMTEVRDLYDSIAPAAFSKFGMSPVPFKVAPDNWWTAPEDYSMVAEILGTVNNALAETGFVPYEKIRTFNGILPNRARATHIAVNPYYIPYLYEDEMAAVLLHEIAHAAGVWSDQHGTPWKNRAASFGPAPAQDSFCMRDWENHPYHNDDPMRPATLDLFSVSVP